MSPKKTALLIFPQGFYSFATIVSGGLSAVGYDVTLANDEYPNNVFGKILGKLRAYPLLSWMTRRVFQRKFIAGRTYDLVLIVKGRGMSQVLLERLRKVSNRIVAYNFDSFAYNPSPLRWYRHVDRYCTFDPADAREHKLPLVELFSSLPSDETPKAVQHEVSAILRNHSDRLAYVDAVLTQLGETKTFIYIYELNLFTFATNALRAPLLYWKFRSHIHFKPLPYADYAGALKASNFTIDYAHPKQSGVTIRCFEALSARTKVITNNPYVMENAAFTAENAIVFAAHDGGADMALKVRTLRNATPDRAERRLSDFLENLLA